MAGAGVRVRAAAGISLLAAGPALAHAPVVVSPDTLWDSWNSDPLVLVPLLMALWFYARGIRKLWARASAGRGVSHLRALSFFAGAAALGLALVSPLDALGGTLLSAHMAQHALLVAIAPPLLVAGHPGVVFAWALPIRGRQWLPGSRPWRRIARAYGALARPMPAAVLYGLALWIWHAPAAFDAALASDGVHVVEHIFFFGTALLFWRALLDTSSVRRAGAALGASFATMIHGGLLAALITMAPHPLYRWYLGRTPSWGWSPLEDQQLAGLLMWVPMGAVYFGACLVLAHSLLAPWDRRFNSAASIEEVSLQELRS
jgi:putative membrane protein